MKHLVSNLRWIPEFYFILVALLWFYITVNQHGAAMDHVINFPAVIVIVIFQIQLFLNDSSLGKVLSGLTALASVFLLIAFIGKLINMPPFDYSSQVFTLKFGNLVLLNFIMAFLMYRKYQNVPVSQDITD